MASTSAKTDAAEFVYTKTIRLRNGKVIHAAAYGLQAFRIRVRRGQSTRRT